MILPNDTHVIVADGEKFRLFRNKGVEPRIQFVELDVGEIHAANQGSGVRHRNSSANPDRTRLSEDNFAAAVADFVNRMTLEGNIASLYVIADPRTLGELRRHFHEVVKSKLVGELARDVTDHGVDAIQSILVGA